ncbi:MAG: cytochrome C biogenesis protein, partial [Verrucomicrobiota bacterium]|nr:cytochrome C biogenesis protein [Verrucomicrobiota bacterium]
MKKSLPWIVTVVFALWAGSSLRVPEDKAGAFATQEFGRLPVVFNGRFQPLDSLARNSLLQLREKQSALSKIGKDAKQIPAVEWLMEMMMNPVVADTRPVFRLDNPDLKGLLGLPLEKDEAKQSDGKHFAWNQIKPKLEELQKEQKRIAAVDQSHRTPYDQAVMRLWNGVGLYMRLQNTAQPQNAGDWNSELNTYISNVPAGVAAARAQQAGQPHDQAALDRLLRDLERFDAMSSLQPPLIVPPHHAEQARDEWMRMGAALMELARG